MADSNYQFVAFYKYCEKCKYEKLKDYEDPCEECTTSPVNLYTDKPVKFVPSNECLTRPTNYGASKPLMFMEKEKE